MSETKQARRWCFTWNNYPGQEAVDKWADDVGPAYYVYGRELAPETGTPHLQGYIEFSSCKRLRTLKTADKSVHWTICKGTQAQNRVYCTKGGDFVEHGTPGAQGTRNDLTESKDIIDRGGTLLDVAENNFGSFVRYHKGFEKYQSMLHQKNASKWRDLKVSYW